MNNRLSFDVEPEVSDMLERLEYEMHSRRSTVAYIIESHSSDPTAEILSSEVFKHYHDEMVQSVAAFETARLEFEASFGNRGIPAGKWNLVYRERKVYVTPETHNGTQSCCKKQQSGNQCMTVNNHIEHCDVVLRDGSGDNHIEHCDVVLRDGSGLTQVSDHMGMRDQVKKEG